MTALRYWAAAVPSEIAGLPTWALNGLSIGSLVSFILIALATSKLWTKRQVDELIKQHEREVANLKDRYDREIDNLRAVNATHLVSTVELLTARATDSITREKEWRDTALELQKAVATLADGLDPLYQQSETTLRIVTAWQDELRRKGDAQ